MITLQTQSVPPKFCGPSWGTSTLRANMQMSGSGHKKDGQSLSPARLIAVDYILFERRQRQTADISPLGRHRIGMELQ